MPLSCRGRRLRRERLTDRRFHQSDRPEKGERAWLRASVLVRRVGFRPGSQGRFSYRQLAHAGTLSPSRGGKLPQAALALLQQGYVHHSFSEQLMNLIRTNLRELAN
ncbi:hypothetical protein MPLSOD_120245 [Mesorhizobium sp. SOD10]|nr:hypothetical protein MPLSOD_120245 [Mesorhizobium sp. SOD10]